MASVDRIQGLSGQQAIKTPCRLATTAAITLSGEQTIDGVAAVEGDRVLVKDQADTTANGVYDVSTGSWTRSLDFDGANDIADGTMVLVGSGSTNADLVFKLNATEPITIGTTALAFTVATTFTDISAFGATLLDDANAAAVLTTLGLSADGQALVAAANYAAMKVLLGLTVGTDVQAYDANLATLAALTLAQGDIITASGADTVTRLAKGTALQHLRMNAGATAPEWASELTITAGTPLVKNPIAANSTTTQAHGLGARPSIFKWELECLTGELNYSAGDVVAFTGGAEGGANVGMNVLADATNTTLLISASVVIMNKTSYVGSAITAANWKMTVTPYLIA